VTPTRFVPAAEASGLIVPIGQFVLRETCVRAVSWQTGIATVHVRGERIGGAVRMRRLRDRD
jgi:EAL domain-containing protein (putative c-di-GMP-specific phosphodiesterase class I)